MAQECDSPNTKYEGINLETLWANARRIELSHNNQVTRVGKMIFKIVSKAFFKNKSKQDSLG